MRLITYITDQGLRPAGVFRDCVVDMRLAVDLFSSRDRTLEKFVDIKHLSIKSFLLSKPHIREKIQIAMAFVLDHQSEFPGHVQDHEVFFPLQNIAFAPPIPDPGKIICIAMNFPSKELTHKTEYPVVFLKPENTITAHNSPIILPRETRSVNYEAELACIIGKVSHNVPPENALDCIFGFTIANDVGDRLLEKRTTQWVSGKMFDTFTPIGPFIVPAGEISDIHHLSIETKLNGRIVQVGNTADMFYKVEKLISYLSGLTTLRPGDLILTGSPKLMDGIPAPQHNLKEGDLVEINIGDLGTLINPVQSGD